MLKLESRYAIVDIASGKATTVPVGNQPRKVAVQQLASGASVSIENFAFLPQVLTVSAGDRVTWSNNDGSPHAIAFKDDPAVRIRSFQPELTIGPLTGRGATNISARFIRT